MHYTLIIYMMSFIVLFGNFYVKAYMEKVLKIYNHNINNYYIIIFRVIKCSSAWMPWVAARESVTWTTTEYQRKRIKILFLLRLFRIFILGLKVTNIKTPHFLYGRLTHVHKVRIILRLFAIPSIWSEMVRWISSMLEQAKYFFSPLVNCYVVLIFLLLSTDY